MKKMTSIILLVIAFSCNFKNHDNSSISDLAVTFDTISFEEIIIDTCPSINYRSVHPNQSTTIKIELEHLDTIAFIVDGRIVYKNFLQQRFNELYLNYNQEKNHLNKKIDGYINIDTMNDHLYRLDLVNRKKSLVFKMKKYSHNLLIKEVDNRIALTYSNCESLYPD